MLTDEQMALLQNAETLISQIKTMEAAQNQTDELTQQEMNQGEREVEMAGYDKKMMARKQDEEDKDDMMSEEDEKMEKSVMRALKSILGKSGEGVTARDDAEDRYEDDLPDTTQDNIDEVAKAVLAQLAGGNSGIEKAIKALQKKEKSVEKSSKMSEIEKAIGDLVDVVKTMVDDQDAIAKSVQNMYEGLGIASSVTKSVDRTQNNQVRKTQQARKPVFENPEYREKVLKEIAQNSKVEEQKFYNDKADVRKGLGGVMESLFVQK